MKFRFFRSGRSPNDTKDPERPAPLPTAAAAAGGRGRARGATRARAARPWAWTLAIVAIAFLASAAWLIGAFERTAVDDPLPWTPRFRVTYMPVPADELVLEHNYRLPAPARVHAYRPGPASSEEIANWTLPAGQRLAWSITGEAGLIQLAFFSPTAAAPLETRLIWIGKATVAVGETPEELARQVIGRTSP